MLDAFEPAGDIRWVDMSASLYDVPSYGEEPVAIETPEGKHGFAERSAGLG
ncbi:hypothetical protein ACFWFR_18210 [Oerskovia sp. NPDC060287]|uniref:hypothetical protein n=1 Tax=Oerskovia sp. NPDC060287 TaxID=3347095 RepID=UPI0036661FC7